LLSLNLVKLISVLEEVFYILYTVGVPSYSNILGLVLIIYLLKSGCFLGGEELSGLNILVFTILVVVLAIISCIIITKLFINLSRSRLKVKYPLIYNVILVTFTIFLVILSLILIILIYKLYSYFFLKWWIFLNTTF
jgi:hypothetical protein